ncbi:MAG: hypothetical protein IAC55_02310 [Tyzzerella sp.]|uniref:Rho termination factor N-terminal domain-containing protein n=1 Tax=Candidatus Fimicola merdigallinarum TaxID=2840819 RepID=A0A9D9DWL2_9FIRM|nr:hypothetical protein [Candidatus Fimicola merdigallinarum]
MYRLKNENVERVTDKEYTRDKLISEGFYLLDENIKNDCEETEKLPSTNLETEKLLFVPLENEELEKLTVTELKEYAKLHNIDLGENTKKADILQILTNRKW